MARELIDGLFLTKQVHEETTSMKERWGPLGYIVCESCGDYYVCHWGAYNPGTWGEQACKACLKGTGEVHKYIWIEKIKFETAMGMR